MFFRLRASVLGVDFPRERFVRTPIVLLKKALDFVSDIEQREANRDSITQAQMTDLLLKIAHGFSGSKKAPPRTLPKDFLPFPKYRAPSQELDEADQPTKFVLSELVKRFQLPVYVFVALNGRAADSR